MSRGTTPKATLPHHPLTILLWIAVVVVVLPCVVCMGCFGGCSVLAGLGAATNPNPPTQAKGKEKAKSVVKDLDVSNLSETQDSVMSYATGSVTNTTDNNYSYVQVEINLLDKSGAVLGSTMANMNNLAPHQKWKFKAPITEEGVKKFEVKDVTGF